MDRIRQEEHGDVLVLTLDAPERRNALDGPMMSALSQRLRSADGEVAAIVLTGTDPAFCAGLDLNAAGTGQLNLADFQADSARDPWRTLQELGTPTIAAVNGPAVTGGLELVLCCDLAVASDQARFADTHARVGIHPSGGMTVLLPRYIGMRAALDMSLTGRFVTAEEALALGLVGRVVPHEQVLEAALNMARSVAEADPQTLRAIRSTYQRLDGLPRADALQREREIGRALHPDPAQIEARRQAVIERGRTLT